MQSKPTTDQILLGIARELREAVLPDVRSEPVKVLVEMMEQLVLSCARRAAHEIAWIHDEAAAIGAAAGRAVGAPASLHLDDVTDWYGSVSRVLSEGIEAAYRSGDDALIERWRALIEARQAHEDEVLGSLDLVGRG
jgi:hypothetical protein